MEILQLPLQSLEERIETELESNVALEQVEHLGDEMPTLGEHSDRPSPEARGPSAGDRYTRAELLRDRAEDDEGDVWRDKSRLSGEPDPKMSALANIPTRGISLEEALLDQWALCEAAAPTMEAGRIIIRSVGENGLLTKSLEAIAAEAGDESRRDGSTAPSIELFIEALKRLQSHLEPVGLAARDLKECLLLQLDALDRRAQPGETRLADARELIERHLHDLEQGKFAAIERKCGWSPERLDDAREALRHLDPAPGRALAIDAAPPVRPDVIIDYDPTADKYSARLSSGLIPNLRVSEEYLALAKVAKLDPKAKEMLGTGIRRARWFIDAIEQRGATLLRVINEVIARQREWLDSGTPALKPLPMTLVARELRMNVSTVSRAVSGKWIETPRGTFELRKLFSGGTETESGSDVSWQAVKAMVAEIIGGESHKAPLSDQAITRALKERGVTLARRTVVKYREQLGISDSRLRKARYRT